MLFLKALGAVTCKYMYEFLLNLSLYLGWKIAHKTVGEYLKHLWADQGQIGHCIADANRFPKLKIFMDINTLSILYNHNVHV